MLMDGKVSVNKGQNRGNKRMERQKRMRFLVTQEPVLSFNTSIVSHWVPLQVRA